VVPKYGDRVKIVFKEFPIPAIHNWALSGALAAQCAYQLKPAVFVKYRSLVFANQQAVDEATKDDVSKAQGLLLNYAEQAGIDRANLATCLDSQASLPRVEASVREGQMLGVDSAPTCFVNGQVVVGMPEPEKFFKIVDNALRPAP
jgi:protein-disulfide isomerase